MVTRLGQIIGRAVNVAGRLAGVVVQVGRRPVVAVPMLVLAVRVVLGVWPAAVVGAIVATVALVVALGACDRRRVSERARQVERGRGVGVVEVGPRAGSRDGGHVEFARGLAGLADWYLNECEREPRP